MTTSELLQQLETYQAQAVSMCRSAGQDYNQQYHPDISPVGWHLGHCIFTESYWIHEMFLEDSACDESQHQLFNPMNTEKTARGPALPSLEELCDWAQKTQAGNGCTLEQHVKHRDSMHLMENNFLLHFLIQHYAQHLETMQLAMAQAANRKPDNPVAPVPGLLDCLPGLHITVPLPAGEYIVGRGGARLPYDNEYPSHTVSLPGCHIMQQPVNNAAYLYFIQCGGYGEKEYWSDAGWRWRQDNDITHPAYWQQNCDGQWVIIDHRGQITLQPQSPVYGLSYYEAEAYANSIGGRLPHEHEWEAARNIGLLQDHGIAWEWCYNSFFPYAGFRAWPYDGYSVPYFDGNHFTLKGGSILTRSVIKRPGFRNYYQADKNFLYAGMRLVFDEAVDH